MGDWAVHLFFALVRFLTLLISSCSCEATERSKGRTQRPDWRAEKKLNKETFGVAGNNMGGGWRGGGRGGYRGRGGYGYGRGGFGGGGGGGYYNNRGRGGYGGQLGLTLLKGRLLT